MSSSPVLLEVRQRTDPQGPVAFWVLVSREVTREGGDQRIRLNYRVLSPQHPHPTGGEFYGYYSAVHDVCAITSGRLGDGGVFIDPPEAMGNRIGTYLLNEMVKWAKQWPDASLKPVVLNRDQGLGEAGVRRNRFYEQFGIKFRAVDDNRVEARSMSTKIRDLNTVGTWVQNIAVTTADQGLAKLLAEAQGRDMELALAKKNLKQANEWLAEVQDHPFRNLCRWVKNAVC